MSLKCLHQVHALAVQTENYAIHLINLPNWFFPNVAAQLVSLKLTRWIVIYPVDSATLFFSIRVKLYFIKKIEAEILRIF